MLQICLYFSFLCNISLKKSQLIIYTVHFLCMLLSSLNKYIVVKLVYLEEPRDLDITAGAQSWN